MIPIYYVLGERLRGPRSLPARPSQAAPDDGHRHVTGMSPPSPLESPRERLGRRMRKTLTDPARTLLGDPARSKPGAYRVNVRAGALLPPPMRWNTNLLASFDSIFPASGGPFSWVKLSTLST